MGLPKGIRSNIRSNIFVSILKHILPCRLPSHLVTMCPAALDIQWFKVSTRASKKDSSFFFFCVRESASELFNGIWKSIGSLLIGLCDAEDYQPMFLLCFAWFHRWPTCFIAPDRNVWKLQKDLKPLRPGSGMCFDHALVILGLYEDQRMLTWSDWWTLSPACWGETRELAKARKHIPPPHDTAVRDMLQ